MIECADLMTTPKLRVLNPPHEHVKKYTFDNIFKTLQYVVVYSLFLRGRQSI